MKRTLKLLKHTVVGVFDPFHGHWIMQAVGVVIAALSTFIMPMKDFLWVIGALVLADLYTGWRKTRKEGAKFNSVGLGRTLEKSLMYLVLMLVARSVDHLYHLEGVLSIAYAIGGLIVGRELLSILENADAVEGTDFAARVTTAFGWLFKKKDA